MSEQGIAIRTQLDELELDHADVADTFSRRLARENGWSELYARRVILEYKRFLLLAGTGSEMVTPSDAVDQAWHLHLLYTRDYRRCCRIFGRRLDHTPSQGGYAERKKFEAAYARTLATYRATFDEEPPSDIWPAVEDRFRADTEFVRVDVKGSWVVPKPRFVRALEARFARSPLFDRKMLLAMAGLLALGCVTSNGSAFHVSGREFLRWFVLGWVICLGLAMVAKRGFSAPRDPEAPALPELDGYEAAYLSGRGTAAVDGAVAVLVATGAAAFDPNLGVLVATAPVAPSAHPLEALVHARLAPDRSTELNELRADAEAMCSEIFARLESLGLVAQSGSALPLLLALAAPIVGVARILTRVGSGHPVGALIVLSFIGAVIAFAAFRPTHRTRSGEALLRDLKRRHAALATPHPADLVTGSTLPLTVGLFGFGMLASDPALGGLHSWYKRPTSDGGGGGCGGGCGGGGCGGGGGGGCGGGCGGCGGCGG